MPSSQHGCVKNKSTDLANHLVRTMIDHAAMHGLSVFVLFVDLEKAFDRVVRELVLGFPQGMVGTKHEYLSGIGLSSEHVEFVCSYIEQHKPIFAQWGVDEAVIETIKSLHTNSFYVYGGLQSAIVARRGGRQGCAFGAVIFNAVYAAALVEVHRTLSAAGVTLHVEQGRQTPWSDSDTSSPSSAEAIDATYVDDEAFVLVAKSPKLLDGAIDILISTLTTVFAKYALDINWRKGKTEAMIKYRGKDATKHFEQRRDQLGLHVKLPQAFGDQRLHIVDRYKHLGGVVAIGGSVMYEVQQRCSNAMAAYTPISAKVFGSPHVLPWLKFHLCNSLVMSRLMYNIHTLVMTPAATAKLGAVYMRVLRRIAGQSRFKGTENISDHDLLQTISKPSIDCLVVRARLKYICRVCKHSNQALYILLTICKADKPLPCVAQLKSDFLLLLAAARYHKKAIPAKNATLAEWLSLFAKPLAWAEVVDCIFFTHSCNDKCSKPNSSNSTLYICNTCTESKDGTKPSFATQRALESHQRTKHKQLNDMRYYVKGDGLCVVCKTVFNSRIRCLAHLLDRRRTKCSDQIRDGRFKRLDESTVVQLDLADREARRQAQRSGHSHPIAQNSATRRDGKVVGRVTK